MAEERFMAEERYQEWDKIYRMINMFKRMIREGKHVDFAKLRLAEYKAKMATLE